MNPYGAGSVSPYVRAIEQGLAPCEGEGIAPPPEGAPSRQSIRCLGFTSIGPAMTEVLAGVPLSGQPSDYPGGRVPSQVPKAARHPPILV